MSQKLMQILRELDQYDFTTSPSVVFMGLFRKELIARGFKIGVAESISSAMKVQLSPGALNDDEIKEAARIYADAVVKMKDALTANGFKNTLSSLEKIAGSLSLDA